MPSQVVLALCFGSLTYGYVFSILTTTFGQPGFFSYLHHTQDPSDADPHAYTNEILGAISGLFSAGGFFGSLFMGWLSESRGRKIALIVACVVSIVENALKAGFDNVAMFLVARFIAGWGAGMLFDRFRNLVVLMMYPQA